jgi:hypothetical protein
VASVYFYISQTVSTSLDETIIARDDLQAGIASKNREKAFLDIYAKTENDWARLPDFFVFSENVIQFIEAMESLGKSVGSEVTLSEIDADNLDSSKKSALGSIRVHVDVKGSWSSVMRTLRLAEAMPYKVTISGVNIDVEEGGNKKTNSWHLTFDIKAAMLANSPVNSVKAQ